MKPAREERWGKAGFWWGIWKQLPGNTNHKGPEPHWKPSQSDQMMDLERFSCHELTLITGNDPRALVAESVALPPIHGRSAFPLTNLPARQTSSGGSIDDGKSCDSTHYQIDGLKHPRWRRHSGDSTPAYTGPKYEGSGSHCQRRGASNGLLSPRGWLRVSIQNDDGRRPTGSLTSHSRRNTGSTEP